MAGNNKLEERIEFIVEQQAQFSVSIQRLEETQANADKRMTRLEGIMVRFYEATGSKINALIDAQLRTDQKLAETDDRLNVFVDVVERFYHQWSQIKRQEISKEAAASRYQKVVALFAIGARHN